MTERNQIDNKFKWDLSGYCKNDEEFYARLENLKPYIENIKVFEGKLDIDDELYKCWSLNDEFEQECSKLMVYVYCKQDEDQREEKANAMSQTLDKVATMYNVAASYISPEISKFSKEKLLALQEVPKFKKYIPYLKDYIRHKDHVLSKEIENFLCGMGEFLGGNSSIFRKFVDADLKFEDAEDSNGKKYPLTTELAGQYYESGDGKLRETTFKNLYTRFRENVNFLTQNYANSIKETCFFAKKRGYSSALNESIYNEEASESVYYKLIEKVRENVDIIHKYFEIKAKLLGLEKDFHIYDKFAPIGEEDKTKISYTEAIEMVKTAVAPLGEEYVSLVQKAYDDKWIDVYQNDGKRSGAYSISVYGGNPLVLLNFDDTRSYVSTIAHELGHAIHSYYSNKNQPFQTADYVIFVAEVASNVNEMLLWRYNLKNCKDREIRNKLFDELFEQVNGSIFRQTMFAEFEAKVHEMEESGEPLTKEKLCSYYLDLNKFYHGDHIILDDEIKYEWVRIPHFYTPFYVYKYATGLICALNLSKKIAQGDKQAIEKYLNFLSSGSSENPIKLLQIAGVDLEKEETFDEVFSWLREELSSWEKMI